jgi:hypothetical protein
MDAIDAAAVGWSVRSEQKRIDARCQWLVVPRGD